jgi:hypothetical protein
MYGRNPADDLVLISANYLKLRAERPFCPLPSDSDFVSMDIIHRCKVLAEKLEAWKDNLPIELLPVRVGGGNLNPDVLGKYYDIYHDIWTVVLMNNQRKVTLLVHELAVTRLLDLQQKCLLSANEVHRIQELRVAALDNIDMICGSVPFLLRSGHVEAATSALWPLFVCAQMKPRTLNVSSATRSWIVERMRKIGNEMGVQQAIFMADLVVQQQEVTELLTDIQASIEDESV